MKTKLLYTCLFTFLLWGLHLVTAGSVIAATDCNGNPCPPVLLDTTAYIPTVTYILIAMSVFVLFIMLVVTGFAFMTAFGNRKKISAARSSLLYTVFGFMFMFLAFLVIPIIFSTLKVNTGSVKIDPATGRLSLHLETTYVATPLPSNELDTTTDTPIPANVSSSGSTGPGVTLSQIDGLTAITGSLPASTGGSDSMSCGKKISYCKTAITDATGKDNGLAGAIAEVVNAYLNHAGAGGASVGETDVLRAMLSAGSSLSNAASIALAVMQKNTNPYPVYEFSNFRAFAITNSTYFDNFAHAGVPIITYTQTPGSNAPSYVVVIDTIGGDTYYLDPTSKSSALSSDPTSDFNHNTVQAVLLEPADQHDYMFPVFTQSPSAGFAAATAICLAIRESGLNPLAINSQNSNGSIDRGIMQINSIHNNEGIVSPPSPLQANGPLVIKAPPNLTSPTNMFDPLMNILAGYTIYLGWGESFSAWSTWSVGHYCW